MLAAGGLLQVISTETFVNFSNCEIVQRNSFYDAVV